MLIHRINKSSEYPSISANSIFLTTILTSLQSFTFVQKFENTGSIILETSLMNWRNRIQKGKYLFVSEYFPIAFQDDWFVETIQQLRLLLCLNDCSNRWRMNRSQHMKKLKHNCTALWWKLWANDELLPFLLYEKSVNKTLLKSSFIEKTDDRKI